MSVITLKNGLLHRLSLSTRRLTIPRTMSGLDAVGYEQLLAADRLESIEAEPGNPRFYTLDNCLIDRESRGVVIACPNSAVPTAAEVDTIGKGAFWRCQAITAVLPDNIRFVGDLAFKDSGVQRFQLSAALESVGRAAFNAAGGYLTLTVSEDNPTYYAADNCLIERQTATLLAAPRHAVIPQGVRRIRELTFMTDSEEKSIVTIPDSVESIEKSPLDMPTAVEFPIVIRAPKHSYAALFAAENHIDCIEM